MEPTKEQFNKFQAMFNHFNKTLFEGKLPPVLLNLSRAGQRVAGFFSPQRWSKGDTVVPEITLNPIHLGRGSKESASTLVHEMVHLWQATFGSPSRGGYHNAEWARKMEDIGLMPSNTGKAGGRKVGQQMDHYVIENGAFDRAFASLSCALPWSSNEPIKTQPKYDKSKKKYVCPGCGVAVWGKPGLRIGCLDCNVTLKV